MSGDLQFLLVVLLSLGVGGAALIYHLRTRESSSQTKPARSPLRSSTRDRDAIALDDKQDQPTLPESGSGDEVAGEDGDRRSAATEESEDFAIVGGPPARTEPGLRPDGRAEQWDLTVAPPEEQVKLPSAIATPEAADLAPARCSMPATRPFHLATGKPVTPSTPEPGVQSDEARSAEIGEQSEIGDHTSGDEGKGRRDCPVLRATEDSKEASADRSPQSAKTASTAVAEETDRPAEEQTPTGAAGPGEAMGVGGVVAVAAATCISDNEQPPGTAAKDEDDEPGVDPATSAQLPRRNRAGRKNPRKYKGLARAAPQPRDAAPQPGPTGAEERAQRELSLPIEVRLRFDHGGFCSVSLIAKRSADLPEDLMAVEGAGEVNLRAMQDEWYQDVVPDDSSRVLRNGTVWTQEGETGQRTWSLSGRELYVLADRPDISGYVSQPCVDLGRDHVVLCTEPLKSRVEEAIRQTGAQPKAVLDESFGVPPGWIVFRSVVPKEPVPPADEADIFNALRPLPRIEISLERGIRLGYANWLDGHPPSVRVYGDPYHASQVRIDGQEAERLADGTYRASGWDTVGLHSVWCAGTSKSYSIVPFEASWELWDAYAFPVAAGSTLRLAICGPLVRAATTESWGVESLAVPETNPVLLGPEPGQIVMAVRASPLRGAPRIASPAFHPVWALPRDPLHCDKDTTRILCVGGSEAPEPKKQQGSRPNNGTGTDVIRWCQLILDANRKGMTTDPDKKSVQALWLSYKLLARRIWRGLRR
jgi:hypothetical protein